VPAEEGAFDAASLGFLTYLTGLVVDRLATRKFQPAPALRPAQPVKEKRRQTGAPIELPEPEPQPELAGEPEPRLATDSTAPEPAAQRPRKPIEDTAPRGGRPSAPAVPRLDDSAPGPGLRMARADVLAAAAGATPGGAPAAPAPPAPPAPPAAMPVARPSVGARRLAGPLAPADGDERREEARRFAKLLVSEIKLYNERAVLEGREHRNLYERLKEDIDRSRQMYDDRIPEDVRASSNFFYEELVRILADGKAEELGIQPKW
jgi:hypothetical protein